MATPARYPIQFLAFTLALPVTVASSFVAADFAFDLYYRLPPQTQLADWTGPVLNQVAPGLAGLLVVVVLCRMLLRRGLLRATVRAHLTRTSLWYMLAALILGVNFANRTSPDFGLWSQAVNWPLAAVLVGIGYDLLLMIGRARTASRTARGLTRASSGRADASKQRGLADHG